MTPFYFELVVFMGAYRSLLIVYFGQLRPVSCAVCQPCLPCVLYPVLDGVYYCLKTAGGETCCAHLHSTYQKIAHYSAMVIRAKGLLQDDGREVLLPPQERVAAVRPFWETLTQEDRVELLSITIEDLRARSKEVLARLRRQAGAQYH